MGILLTAFSRRRCQSVKIKKKRVSHRATKDTEIKQAKVFGKESEKEPVFKRVCLCPSKTRGKK